MVPDTNRGVHQPVLHTSYNAACHEEGVRGKLQQRFHLQVLASVVGGCMDAMAVQVLCDVVSLRLERCVRNDRSCIVQKPPRAQQLQERSL